MLESASGSLPSYPGHPPAAYGGLVSLVPDLNSWPSEGARLRRAAAAWSKRYDPLLRHEVEGVDGLGSLGHQTGTSEPQPDEHGRATCASRAKGPHSRRMPRCGASRRRCKATASGKHRKSVSGPHHQGEQDASHSGRGHFDFSHSMSKK